MTIAFAEQLKSELGCSQCSAKAMPKRKFCEQHLHAARRSWHRHVALCRREGRCINCQRPKQKGEQRCSACKTRNRSRCLGWYQDHREQLRRRYQERVREGKCTSCGKRDAVPGHTRCKTCYPKGYQP